MSVVEAFDFFAASIAELNPSQVIKLKAPPSMAERMEVLVSKKKEGTINSEETIELDRYLALDLIISLAKARAIKLLAAA